MIVSDNGIEFTSNAMFAWAQDSRIVWHFIARGKPTQSGSVIALTAGMRDELLNENLSSPRSGPGQDHELGRRLQPATPALAALTPIVYGADLSATCDRPHNPTSSADRMLLHMHPGRKIR